MFYIIPGIVAILAVGISAGFLARRKRLIKEAYSLKDQGYVMCDGTDLRAWDGSYTTEDTTAKKWYNKEGQLHRTDGPAIVWAWGTKDWYINGKRHREDGPATEYSDGNKSFYLNGTHYSSEEEYNKIPRCETDKNGNKRWLNKDRKYHREDGPAWERTDGTKEWFINGSRHREDGPAVEWASGNKEYWLNGYCYLEEDWKKELDKPKCTTYDNGIKRWTNKAGQLHRTDGPAVEGLGEYKSWYLNGKRHREDGPATVYSNGNKQWLLNGKTYTELDWLKELGKSKPDTDKQGNKYWKNEKGNWHREDGPACEFEDGAKIWFINGEQHRTDGPAIELANGTKKWCINGKYHREDGPAVEHADGTKEWWLNGWHFPYEADWKKELNKPICKTSEDGNKFWENKEGYFHREDGPAIEYKDGTKDWYINGKRHRENGPAIEWVNGEKSWYLNGTNYSEEDWKKERLEKLKLEVMAANPHIGLGVKINATIVKFSLGQISNFSEIVDWNKGVVGEYNVFVKDTEAVKLDSYAYYGEMTLRISQRDIWYTKLNYVLYPKGTTKNFCPHPEQKLNAGSGIITLFSPKQEEPKPQTFDDKPKSYKPGVTKSQTFDDKWLVQSGTFFLYHDLRWHSVEGWTKCTSLEDKEKWPGYFNSKEDAQIALDKLLLPNAVVAEVKEEPKPPTVEFDKWSGVICNIKEIIDWNKIVGVHKVRVEEETAVIIDGMAYWGKLFLHIMQKESLYGGCITLHYQFSSKEASCRHQPALPRHNNGVKASGSLTLTPPKEEPKLITAKFDFGKPDNNLISNMDEIWEACPYVQPRTIYVKQQDAIGAGYYGEMTLNINEINTWNDMLTLSYKITCLNKTVHIDGVSRNDRVEGTVSFTPKSTKKPVLPIVKFKDKIVANLFEIFGELKGTKEKLVYVHKEDLIALGDKTLYGELRLKLNDYKISHQYQSYQFYMAENTMFETMRPANFNTQIIRNFHNNLPIVIFHDKKPSNLDMLFYDKIGDPKFAPLIPVWVQEKNAVLISGELYHGEMSLAYAINSDKSYCFGIVENTASEKREGNVSSGCV